MFLQTFKMKDAAFAPNIQGDFCAAGYFGGPEAYHVWAPGDWSRFKHALPGWVAGLDGDGEGAAALAALRKLGVPEGAFMFVDMEDRDDTTYVENFGAQVRQGYRPWVYGSFNSIFKMPALNGRWVADYSINPMVIFSEGDSVRAVQYAANLPPDYDLSLVRDWVLPFMWQPAAQAAAQAARQQLMHDQAAAQAAALTAISPGMPAGQALGARWTAPPPMQPLFQTGPAPATPAEGGEPDAPVPGP